MIKLLNLINHYGEILLIYLKIADKLRRMVKEGYPLMTKVYHNNVGEHRDYQFTKLKINIKIRLMRARKQGIHYILN